MIVTFWALGIPACQAICDKLATRNLLQMFPENRKLNGGLSAVPKKLKERSRENRTKYVQGGKQKH